MKTDTTAPATDWATLPRPMQRELEALLAGQVEQARYAAKKARHAAQEAAERARDAEERLREMEAQAARWMAKWE